MAPTLSIPIPPPWQVYWCVWMKLIQRKTRDCNPRLDPTRPQHVLGLSVALKIQRYIFGGYSSTGGHLNDIHKLSLAENNLQWSEVSTSRVTTTLTDEGEATASGNNQNGAGGLLGMAPARPPPRRHAAVAILLSSTRNSHPTSSRSAILFGGMRGSTAEAGGGGNYTGGDAVVFGDVWRLELAGNGAAWEELEVEGGALPR